MPSSASSAASAAAAILRYKPSPFVRITIPALACGYRYLETHRTKRRQHSVIGECTRSFNCSTCAQMDPRTQKQAHAQVLAPSVAAPRSFPCHAPVCSWQCTIAESSTVNRRVPVVRGDLKSIWIWAVCLANRSEWSAHYT